MSDTDTDDTDLLLLIPPNYYTKTAERLLEEVKMSVAAAADALAMPPPAIPTTAAYQFLQPSKKMELNHINARLQNMALDDGPSDISSISTNTVRTAKGSKQSRELYGMAHSTPKSGSAEPTPFKSRQSREDNILLEIDDYLDDRRHHHSEGYLRQPRESQTAATSLPSIRMEENKLISLSELWGKSHSVGTGEEQLRRQHLEKTVKQLQSQLLEYQQRISVAIEVDRTKDVALNQAEQANKALFIEMQQLRDQLHRQEVEQMDTQGHNEDLKRELAQAVSLATEFQQKMEKLEAELERHQKEGKLCLENLEQMELQLQGSKRAEELSHAELNKLRDRFAQVDYKQEKLKARVEDLERDNNTLQQQKEMLQEYHQKQKTRADNLETQRKSLQESLANLTEIESNLKKKLESQQKSLKLYYQQQMETVVTKKLQEFQTQLDKSEEQLKQEARERERLIAERAVKQLEMINEKNNQELNLIQEKHQEEVELYRLQLANASKKIEELELKLSCYKTKRADIAEKLHGVMEAQWQQALAILTSPNQSSLMPLHSDDTDTDSPELLNNARVYPETPKTSKSQRSNQTEKNNLDMMAKRDPASPMDKLQAYIELLLSKSPSDFDKLDEILALTANKQLGQKAKSKSKPPPWKC